MNKLTIHLFSLARFGPVRIIGFVVLIAAFVALPALPAHAGQTIANSVPSYVSNAPNLGPVDPSTVIEVSIWLKPQNQSALDQIARDLYNRNSPSYRQWLKMSDVAARFAPSDAEAKAVEQFFTANGLSVVSVGPNSFYVRARGTVADIEAAFHVTLSNYSLRGETIRANNRDPYIDIDSSVAPVLAVAGLDSGRYSHPLLQRPTLSKNGKTVPPEKVTAGAPFFSSDCFTGATTEKYTTDGTYPIGIYSGNAYFTNVNSPGCAYTPPDIYTAYNLSGLYSEAFNGTGQTIVIVDWCGSLTIESDANVFNAKFGLPALNSSNFAVIQTPTKSQCAGPDPEINIDVEWAHAIAPGANIDLVVPPSASFQDVDQAVFYAVNYDLGNSLSGSYGSVESETPEPVLETENLISEIAAVTGISTNFATGDYGDYTIFGIPATVSAPADSPYATGIGGVSLALKKNKTMAWEAGWGTDLTNLDQQDILNPPDVQGFYAGSGGGPSDCAIQDYNPQTGTITCIAGYPKPSYQSGIPGSTRMLPDISWLGDPYTGAVIFLSESGQTGSWYAYGGTSLATPMFSALWAIANEEAGSPLGQAAPYVYSMPSTTITDVVPVGSSTNVTATIEESKTVTDTYNADQVMGVSGTFYSGLWNYPFTEDFVIAVSFGTDSGLMTAPGWDDVTGVGTPNGQAFADYFAPAATKAR